VIGGAMANTFLAAQGAEVGRSLVERDMLETARGIAEKAAGSARELILPVDVAVAERLEAGAARDVHPADACPADRMILDVGPATVARINSALEGARTLVWNGPLGAFETAPFDEGTSAVARRAAALTRAGALLSVAGGGDTVGALNGAGAADDFTYISTAGGAFLEWLEGRTLPGVAALEESA
jgi:phosphoglycerate kinase